MKKAAKNPARLVRNAVIARVQSAHHALHQMKSIDDQVVHSVRKDLKCVRAGLRLLRGTIRERDYAAENRRLRDAARLLSGVRDAAVLLGTAGELVKREKNIHDRKALSKLVDVLTSEHKRLHGDMPSQRKKFKISYLMLAQSEREIARWPVKGQGEYLANAMKRLFRKSQRAIGQACKVQTDDALHEARKQAKYFALALEILTAFSPHRAAAAIRRSKRITEQLGKDRDLALVLSRLSAPRSGEAVTKNRTFTRIRDRRTKLQRNAFKQAKLLHKQDRSAFLRQASF